jgi:hypothetical protein
MGLSLPSLPISTSSGCINAIHMWHYDLKIKIPAGI